MVPETRTSCHFDQKHSLGFDEDLSSREFFPFISLLRLFFMLGLVKNGFTPHLDFFE
jgi:hypothetical protein